MSADKSRPPAVRTGQGPPKLTFEQFRSRFVASFFDPNFDSQRDAIEQLAKTAWHDYQGGRKSPVTRKAGPGFSDPDYELSVEWLAARTAILEAQQRHDDASASARVLLICAAARNDKTCPGEMSKSFRMAQLARDEMLRYQIEVDLLDLSLLTSEYQRVIYPCKACVSTAMPLCHWPCSCYPNHSLGQVNDWMSEIYPRWVAAHGILIVTPVYWYQAPSVLKLMIDRLVCADGGNPDPSSTHGKRPAEAKRIELEGWSYPKHLAGRSYGVIVHGDAAGTDGLRRALSDWLNDMQLIPAGTLSSFDRMIGYYEPYATSHDSYDADPALHEEVRNAAHALANQVLRRRAGERAPDEDLSDPRPK